MQFFQRLIAIISYPFQLLFTAPVALLTASRHIRGMSLAARAALAVGVFMLLLMIVGTLLALRQPTAPDFATVLMRYTLWLAIFTIVTPPVVYLAVWLWGEGRQSRFPDIDRAWRSGTAALAREGVAMAEAPVFLVLGIRNERQARAFMNASGLQFAIYGIPEGASPLYFFVAKDYSFHGETWSPVFVVVTDACQTSKLLAKASESGRDRLAKGPDDTVRPGEMRSGQGAGTVVGAGAGDNLRGTMVADASPPPAARQAAPRAAALGGTMVVGEDLGRTQVASEQAADLPLILDKQEGSRQSNRLAHVCRLLSRGRDPFCPLNGVLVVTPFAMLRRGLEQARHLAAATRHDLRTIQRDAQLRCPVISLIGGMEHEAGFGELVRRVGPARAIDNRIGKRFEPWNPATRDRMEALGVHAFSTLEDNVYERFKEPDGYNKPGNGKMYGLVCRTRTWFLDALKEFLASAYAPQDAASEERPMLFAGCYFAATGEIEKMQGFLKGVLADKLLETQDDLQWTEEAIREDAAREAWARAGMLASGLLVIATVVLYFWKR
jgi:hypothetical protein